MGSEVLLSGAVKIYLGDVGATPDEVGDPVTTSIWTLLGRGILHRGRRAHHALGDHREGDDSCQHAWASP